MGRSSWMALKRVADDESRRWKCDMKTDDRGSSQLYRCTLTFDSHYRREGKVVFHEVDKAAKPRFVTLMVTSRGRTGMIA